VAPAAAPGPGLSLSHCASEPEFRICELGLGRGAPGPFRLLVILIKLHVAARVMVWHPPSSVDSSESDSEYRAPGRGGRRPAG
jgi:hypothetical protein